MAYVPDCCYMDAKTELIGDSGAVKHAALTLYGYYCLRRNNKTGLCFPKNKKTSFETGITPLSNITQLKTFLKNVAWIEVYENGVIRPLKGFYPEEYRFFIWLKNFLSERETVLLARSLVLMNRTGLLLYRSLFKGSINQPNEPTQLTSEATNLRNDKSAAAPAETNSLKNQPAGKPAPRVPASQEKPAHAAPAGKPADERRTQPAIQMVKEITGRYPPKDVWDRIIREIREKPKIKFFRQSWEIWRSVGGSPQNFEKWLLEPAKTGLLPEIYAGGKNGKSPPVEIKPVVEKSNGNGNGSEREKALEMLLEMRADGLEIENSKQFYSPEDWAWLVEEMKNYV